MWCHCLARALQVGNMHGDEPGGRVLLPMLAEWLCSKQTTDARAARIIDSMHLFLMPTMNPDGFAKRSRYNAGM
jgi:carboxypeptidase D